MSIDRWVDTLLTALTAFLFFAMAVAILLPRRRQDALSLSLVAMKLAFAALFGAVTLQLLHVLPPLLPPWARWALRLGTITSEVSVFVALVRAGGFRWRADD